MAETVNFQRTSKKQTALDMPLEAPQAPELKVTLERPESLQALAEARAAQPSESEAVIVAEARDVPDDAGQQESLALVEMKEPAVEKDATEDKDTSEDTDSRAEPYVWSGAETPSMTSSLRSPMLAIAAVTSLVFAGWSYSTLEETRAQLMSVTAAKASVDKQLGDAQARLTAAEEAVANVKAALTAVPSSAKKAAAEPAAAAPAVK